jgi:hypothetical protein
LRSDCRSKFSIVGSPLPYRATAMGSRPLEDVAEVVVVVDAPVVVVVVVPVEDD